MKGGKFYFLAAIVSTLLLSSQFAMAQSPGGITPYNTMWLRSDSGVSLSGTKVTNWKEISGAAVTGDFVVAPINGNIQTSPLLVNAGINFNPFVRFDGITAALSSANAFSGDMLVDNKGGTVTVFQVVNIKGGVVWLKWEVNGNGDTARLGFEFNPSASSVRFDFPVASGVPNGRNIGVTNVLNKDILSTCYANPDTSYNRLNGALDNAIPLTGITGDFTQATHNMTLGNNYSFNLPAQIDVAEEIIYARQLSFAERNKVESYLAVKYGMTLNQAAANNNNYTASNDTIIWNRASNSKYANNITGIGRDDASALMQKQSKSINTGATGGIVTIYNSGNYAGGVFPATNAANKNSFASDLSYTLFGDNALPTTLTACGDSNKISLMQRVWKVQQYGNIGMVTLSVDQTSVPATIKNLIVSSDSTFHSGSVQVYPLTLANGKLYVSLNLNNNQFFTFGGSSIAVALNIVQPNCVSAVDTVTAIVTGGTSPITYSWTTLGFITPTIQNIAAGNYTLVVKQAGGCADSLPFTIATVSNVPAPVFGAIAPICKGGATTITILNQQIGASYNWYDSAKGGKFLYKDSIGVDSSFTTPLLNATTTYYVQTTSSCASITRTSVAVVVNQPTSSTTPAQICSPNSYSFNGKVYSAAGTYKDTLSNWVGCDSIAILQLIVNTPKSYDSSVSICSGDSIIYKGSVIKTAGIHPFHFQSSAGCDSVVNLTVTINPKKVPIFNPIAAICTGDVAPILPTTSLEGVQGAWSPATVSNTQTGTYTFTPNSLQCDTTTSIIITVNSKPTVPPITGSNTTVPVGNMITLSDSVVGGVWSVDSTTIAIINSASGALTGKSVGTANVYYIVSGICGNDTVSIKVSVISTNVFIPNLFTPNAAVNNVFYVRGAASELKEVDLRIFDSWGGELFHSTDPLKGWDGTYKGKQQPTGVYVYVVRITPSTGNSYIKKGSITLIR